MTNLFIEEIGNPQVMSLESKESCSVQILGFVNEVKKKTNWLQKLQDANSRINRKQQTGSPDAVSKILHRPASETCNHFVSYLALPVQYII